MFGRHADHAVRVLQIYLPLFMAQVATMRISIPPVRFADPQVVVPPRRVQLEPFQGQPRKYSGTHRFPQLVIKDSRISNAGAGLFLEEKVRAGQILTLFRRNHISEARAKVLKKKVSKLLFSSYWQGGGVPKLSFRRSYRAIDTFGSTALLAAAWIPSQTPRQAWTI